MMGLYRDTGKSNGNSYSMLGLYRDNGKWKMQTTIVCRGCIGIMEKKMETTIVYAPPAWCKPTFREGQVKRPAELELEHIGCALARKRQCGLNSQIACYPPYEL